MTDRPGTASTGSFLAILGGIICIIGTALTLKTDNINLLVGIGIPLLSIVLFFAVSGELNVNGSMKREVMIFLCFLNIGALAFASVYGAMNLYLGIVLMAIAAGVLALSSVSGTARWIKSDRI